MSYTALYRKFRPDNFDDVKGQDHIVTTLTNQIKHNRIGHAYLFCGTRGSAENCSQLEGNRRSDQWYFQTDAPEVYSQIQWPDR